MTQSAVAPVVEGVITETAEGPRLVASRCGSCDAHYFPHADTCASPGCGGGPTEPALLGPHGTVWSYTVLHYPPPPPFAPFEPFRPYGVALVTLPEGLRVAGIVLNTDVDDLAVGQPAELVVHDLPANAAGEVRSTWMFSVNTGVEGENA